MTAWMNNRHPLLWSLAAFVLLSAYAINLYPGGSDVDARAAGFSWLHNYWCHLLDKTAMNGQENEGRPAAIAASLVLAGGLAATYYRLSNILNSPLVSVRLTKVMLTSALCGFIFLSTPFHDEATLILCIAGFIFLISLLTALINSKAYLAVAMIMVCMAISGFTALIYFTGWHLPQLALLQKISFGCFVGTTLYLNYTTRQSKI